MLQKALSRTNPKVYQIVIGSDPLGACESPQQGGLAEMYQAAQLLQIQVFGKVLLHERAGGLHLAPALRNAAGRGLSILLEQPGDQQQKKLFLSKAAVLLHDRLVEKPQAAGGFRIL